MTSLPVLILLATMVFGSPQNRTVTPPDLSGEVVDTQGNPLPGVSVSLRSQGADNQEVSTDSFGRFEFRCLQRGEYELVLEHAGFLRTSFRLIFPLNWPPTQLGIVLPFDPFYQEGHVHAAGSLASQVVVQDSAGQPLPGVEVTKEGSLLGVTDACGRLLVEGVDLSGIFELKRGQQKIEGSGEVEVEPGKQRIILRIP